MRGTVPHILRQRFYERQISLLVFLRLTASLFFVAACGGQDEGREGPDTVASRVDATRDTVVIHVTGDVNERGLRSLKEERRFIGEDDAATSIGVIGGMTLDHEGQLWAYDASANQFLVFDSSASLVRRIGRTGAGPGEFRGNNGVVAFGSGVAILDAQNARVSFFSSSGVLERIMSIPAGFATDRGLVADNGGRLFLRRPVTPPTETEITGIIGLVRLTEDGRLVDSIIPPHVGAARQPYQAVRMVDGAIARATASSRFGSRSDWGWHGEGYFVTLNGSGSEVLIAHVGRKPVKIVRLTEPVRISEPERREDEARVLWTMRRTEPSWMWSGPPVPDVKPPIEGLFLSRDGRIWLRMSTPSERMPQSELPVPRADRPPVYSYRSRTEWEVFTQDGAFLGRVVFPTATTLVEADADVVWATRYDQNGFPELWRYTVEPTFLRVESK